MHENLKICNQLYFDTIKTNSFLKTSSDEINRFIFETFAGFLQKLVGCFKNETDQKNTVDKPVLRCTSLSIISPKFPKKIEMNLAIEHYRR